MEEEVYTLFIIIASSDICSEAIRCEAIAVYGRDAEHAREVAGDWLRNRRSGLPIVTALACPGGFSLDPRVVYPHAGVVAFAGQFTRELAEQMGRVRPE